MRWNEARLAAGLQIQIYCNRTVVGSFLDPSRGRILKSIHSLPYSVAQTLERGSKNNYSIIQGSIS